MLRQSGDLAKVKGDRVMGGNQGKSRAFWR